ncbi:hypothetical protein AAGW05_13080 [Arthrobacter sp. LAPM80]|uniref:hypothetical protein n=1 Tax=Arthrobacter sp. LAPM80 TaxID=3141788 RepID=UPI00398B3FE9
MNSSMAGDDKAGAHPAAPGAKGLHLVQGVRPGLEHPASSGLQGRLPANEHAWRTRQLNDSGLNPAAIEVLLDTGVLIRIRRGAYVRAAYWESLDQLHRDKARIILHAHAAVATERAYSVYSHVSAARLHDLPLWKADERIHITRAGKCSTAERASDVRIHSRQLRDDECTVIDGVPVTNLLRTTVDCALTMTYQQVLILMDHALRSGIPRDVLEREASVLDRHRGIRIFRAALDFATQFSESAGETLTRDLIRVCNIEPPQLQFTVPSRNGSYRADFAWPAYKVILEFDGAGKYFNYRPTQEVLRDERVRENTLIELGWSVIRIEWRDLFNEHAFKTRLVAALRKGGMK